MLANPVVITQVLTPAATYDLIDLATLKTLNAITGTLQDVYLSLVISQISTIAANYCNRVFPVETLSDSFWPRRRGYLREPRRVARPLILSRNPIVTVTSILEGVGGVAPTALVAGVDYQLDAIKGFVYRLDTLGYPTTWVADSIVATYSAGYSPIPADLQLAAASWVKAIAAAQTRDSTIKSETVVGVYSATYGAAAGSPLGVPADIAEALDNYNAELIG
jgi:hypothetical protein